MFLKSRFAVQDCFQLPFFEMALNQIVVLQIYAGKSSKTKVRTQQAEGFC